MHRSFLEAAFGTVSTSPMQAVGRKAAADSMQDRFTEQPAILQPPLQTFR